MRPDTADLISSKRGTVMRRVARRVRRFSRWGRVLPHPDRRRCLQDCARGKRASAGARSREYNLWDVKSDLMALLDEMGSRQRRVPCHAMCRLFPSGNSGRRPLGPKTVSAFSVNSIHKIVREMGCRDVVSSH